MEVSQRRLVAFKYGMHQVCKVAFHPSNPMPGTFTRAYLNHMTKNAPIKNVNSLLAILSDHRFIVKKDGVLHVKYNEADIDKLDSTIEKWIGEKIIQYQNNKLHREEMDLELQMEAEEAERLAKIEAEKLAAEETEKLEAIKKSGTWDEMNIPKPEEYAEKPVPVIHRNTEIIETSSFWGFHKKKITRYY